MVKWKKGPYCLKKMVLHSSIYILRIHQIHKNYICMWIPSVNILGIILDHLGCKVWVCNHRYSDYVLFSLLSFQQRVTVWVWRPTVATPCTVRTICLVVNHRWTLARIVAAASAQLRAAAKTPFMTTMRVIALGVSNIFTLTSINSLAPDRYDNNFKSACYEHMLRIKFMSTCEMAFSWMPQIPFDDKWTLVHR